MESGEYLLKISDDSVTLEIILKKIINNKNITQYYLLYGNCNYNKEEIYDNIKDAFYEIIKIINKYYDNLMIMINVCKILKYKEDKIREYILCNNNTSNYKFNYLSFNKNKVDVYFLLEWSSGIISDDIKQLIKNETNELLLCSIDIKHKSAVNKYNTIITNEIYKKFKNKLGLIIQ